MKDNITLQVLETPTIYIKGPSYRVRCAIFQPLDTEVALKFNGPNGDFEVLGPTIGYSGSCQEETCLIHFGRLTERCAQIVKETLKKDPNLNEHIYNEPKLNKGKLVFGVNI
jgi:hypothetical protein